MPEEGTCPSLQKSETHFLQIPFLILFSGLAIGYRGDIQPRCSVPNPDGGHWVIGESDAGMRLVG